MSTTLWNLDNAFLTGRTKYKRWKVKHDERWYQPVREAQERMLGRMLIDQLPEGVRGSLQEMAPEAYNTIVGGKNGS